jgi:hypothetical protein
MARRAEEIGLNRSVYFTPRGNEAAGPHNRARRAQGTEGSNPAPSSGESANHRFLSDGAEPRVRIPVPFKAAIGWSTL